MGQNLDSMSQQRSQAELLYELACSGNVEAIKALSREGVTLEWMDQKGRSPLMVACLNPHLIDVVKNLIQLGANLDAYRPGRHGGTPLHHAAKRGLDGTVLLLLSHGANAMLRNDDCQTALDVARIKGHTNVVRIIENHVCYFSGWLRELYGPGFLEAFAPHLLTKKIWVVVIPCGLVNPTRPIKLELVMYPTLQDAQPRTVIALWKAKIEEPKLHRSNPTITIFDQLTKTSYKLASSDVTDKMQIQRFYDACRASTQIMTPPVLHNMNTSAPYTLLTDSEAPELAMAISASIQSQTRPNNNTELDSEQPNTNGWGDPPDHSSHNGWAQPVRTTQSNASSSRWTDEMEKEESNGWAQAQAQPVSTSQSEPSSNGPMGKQPVREDYSNGWGLPDSTTTTQHANDGIPYGPVVSGPSAPLIPQEGLDQGPIHYPSIDLSPVDWLAPSSVVESSKREDVKAEESSSSSSCVICWEASVEGACIPCGHMAGCMACLNDIKEKKGVCPVCRAHIDKVIRIYAV